MVRPGNGIDAVSNFLQYTVFGIMFGAGYAIAATGLVVTYTTSGVFNFAQGAVGMIAAFCYWELVTAHHVPILVALVLILIVGASISGALVERVLMRRLHGASAERPVMVTLGLLVILTGLATVDLEPDHPAPGGQHGQRPVPPGRDQHPVPGGADHRRGRRPWPSACACSSTRPAPAWPCGPWSTTPSCWPCPASPPTG